MLCHSLMTVLVTNFLMNATATTTAVAAEATSVAPFESLL